MVGTGNSAIASAFSRRLKANLHLTFQSRECGTARTRSARLEGEGSSLVDESKIFLIIVSLFCVSFVPSTKHSAAVNLVSVTRDQTGLFF